VVLPRPYEEKDRTQRDRKLIVQEEHHQQMGWSIEQSLETQG